MQTTSIALTALLLCAGASQAQTLGYIAGQPAQLGSLTSFNASTGAVVNSFTNSSGAGTPFAVANDDSTLYIPTLALPGAGQLNVVSGQTGQLLNSVSLPDNAHKAILSSDGSTVYVMTWASGRSSQVQVLDTATLATTGTINFGAQFTLVDIALSPDNTTLYTDILCLEACNPPPSGCTITSGICIFNASTLAFESQVAKVVGNLAVSHDGNSVYMTNGSADLYIVNTSSLAISRTQVSHYNIEGPVAISPTGNYGLVMVGPNAEMSTTAFVLDTSSNTIVKPFFGNAPGGAFVVNVTPGSAVAFTPHGKAVWMLLECQGQAVNCTIPGGTGRAVWGIDLTSGTVIAETSVPQDAQVIAFPN